MGIHNYKNLSGKILIATPNELAGGLFYRSLIYILSHAEEGSIGLIVNQLVKSIPLSIFLQQEGLVATEKFYGKDNNSKIISDKLKLQKPLSILFGGPNEMERMFFLHTDDYQTDSLFKCDDTGIVLSVNPKILTDISLGTGPKKNVSVVGYTLWSEGELEQELANNLWIISEYDNNLIFSDTQGQRKWDLALKNLGIKNHLFNPNIGSS